MEEVGTQERTASDIRGQVLGWGLYAALLAPIVIYGILDLTNDDPARPNTLARFGNTLIAGISNGAIIALVALGYTLVYGIIELINFAHGDVFMMGTFITASLFGDFGTRRGGDRVDHPRDPRAGHHDGGLRRAQRDDRACRLSAVCATLQSSRR